MSYTVTDSVVSVDVHVTVNTHGVVIITCTPYTAQVTAPNTLLTFNLVTTGWQFPTSSAIVLAEPSTDFPYPSWTVNDTQATLFDVNALNATFAYTVFVQATITGAIHSVDPQIKNGGTTTC